MPLWSRCSTITASTMHYRPHSCQDFANTGYLQQTGARSTVCSIRDVVPTRAHSISAGLLPGNAAHRAGGKELLVGAAAVGGNDRECRQPFMQVAEPGNDLIGDRLIVVAVAED